MPDTAQPIITAQAVQAALIPAVGISQDLAAAINTCAQDVLAALNKGSAAGIPVGILIGVLSLNEYLVKDTLRVVIEQTHPDGTPIDSTAEALTAMEQAAEAQLAVVKQAQAAHTAQTTPPVQG
jgi:2-oxoglutarate dehydrogenase complex dehydrogenase (E1) component-like enzyme